MSTGGRAEASEDVGVVTGEELDSCGDPQLDLVVTLLPTGEGASGAGDGVREDAASILIASLALLARSSSISLTACGLPRMWSIPKVRRPLIDEDGEDMLQCVCTWRFFSFLKNFSDFSC